MDSITSGINRITGTVKWFNPAKGFGFIAREGGEDIFFHLSAFQNAGYPNVEEGQKVEFTIDDLSGSLIAIAPSDLNYDPPRKATLVDPLILASNATNFIASYLIKTGEKNVEKAGDNLPAAGDMLWDAIIARFHGNPAAEGAAKELSVGPSEKDNQEALNIQLRKALKDDSVFAADLAKLLEAAQSSMKASVINTGSGAVATDKGTAAGAGGVAVAGNVLGDVLINAIKIIIENREAQREAELALAEYLNYIIANCVSIPQFPHAPINRNSPKLMDVYIPIHLDRYVPAEMSLAEYLALLESERPDRELTFDQEPARPIHAIEALSHHRDLVLLGKPGSGKSTFVSFVAFILARAGQGETTDLVELGKDWLFGPLLPVRIIIRRFAEYLANANSDGIAADVWDFIEVSYRQAGLLPSTAAAVQKIARLKGALFLFDGLDEVNQTHLRTKVLNAVNMFKQTAGQNSRFLITARPYAWDVPDPLKGEYSLADLDTEQIDFYIKRWCQTMVPFSWRSQTDPFKMENDLKLSVRRADLYSIIKVPLLLNMVVSMHASGGHFPNDRIDLYNLMAEFMIEKWNRTSASDRALLDALQVPGLTLDYLREILQRIAFDAHRAGAGQVSTADISEETLKRAFRKALGDSDDKARIVINYIEQRAGLLIGLGYRESDAPRQYAFSHRTLQEYMAACHLASRIKFAAEVIALSNEDPDYWHEVLVMAARIAGEERGIALAHRLVDHTDPQERLRRRALEVTDCQKALLAGEQLLEIGLQVVRQDESNYKICADIAKWIVLTVAQGNLPTPRLIRAGDVLAYLGDPRFRADCGQLPDDPLLGFVDIPAGRFRMGSDAAKDERTKSDEQPQHEVSLPRFLIARYPTTVAQFQAFVEDSGCKPKDERSLQDLPNHPVRYITWYEALAYCEWLNETLKNSPVIPTLLANLLQDESWRVTLPSEAEIERATRSHDGRIYPWGDDFDVTRANTLETGISGTSAVGCFPKGASPNGLLDVCGNVWEWTRSVWGEDPRKPEVNYPYHPESDRENLHASPDILRVMRGGSFNDGQWSNRSACRFRNIPDFKFQSVGFRVAITDLNNIPGVMKKETVPINVV